MRALMVDMCFICSACRRRNFFTAARWVSHTRSWLSYADCALAMSLTVWSSSLRRSTTCSRVHFNSLRENDTSSKAVPSSTNVCIFLHSRAQSRILSDSTDAREITSGERILYVFAVARFAAAVDFVTAALAVGGPLSA